MTHFRSHTHLWTNLCAQGNVQIGLHHRPTPVAEWREVGWVMLPKREGETHFEAQRIIHKPYKEVERM